ncbi:MAG: hypothetical protein QOE65_2461 [Solirubrobacteraceae bacterium]|jgi:hypothetical protein|nr:hypothetical protein [Solirubrobacteraceae bacterium]
MGRRVRVTVSAVAATLACGAPAAAGAPVSGPHETVDLTTSTTRPGASAALGYAARYHAANDPDGEPPALRHLAIELPPGTLIDTSVPPRCAASDFELQMRGEAACPPAARIGAGQATVKQPGLGATTYDTVIYNADHDMLELVKSGDAVLAVVHTYVHGTTLEGPIPTCLTGGTAPDGCPFDQLILLANHLQVRPVSAGGRNYGTTPPTCSTGRWDGRVTFSYGDGSLDRLTASAPCVRPAARRVTRPRRRRARPRACRRRHRATAHRRARPCAR